MLNALTKWLGIGRVTNAPNRRGMEVCVIDMPPQDNLGKIEKARVSDQPAERIA